MFITGAYVKIISYDISGSHGGEYDVARLKQTDIRRCVLPPLLVQCIV
jgi:hypothetical protein